MNSPEMGNDPKMQAEMRWGVNLAKTADVMAKAQELLRDPKTRRQAAELSNLFVAYSEAHPDAESADMAQAA